MPLSLKYSMQLDEVVRQELQQLVSALNAEIEVNHNQDGTHGAVVANSLEVQGGLAGEWIDLPYDAARFTTDTPTTVTWTVDATDLMFLKYCRVGRLATVAFQITLSSTATSAGDKATGLIINIPELNIQPYGQRGVPISFHCGGGGNSTADGHFPIDITATNRYSGGGTSFVLERFNSIERGGASVQYGNWPNEANSIQAYGQISFQTTVNNTPVTYVP